MLPVEFAGGDGDDGGVDDGEILGVGDQQSQVGQTVEAARQSVGGVMERARQRVG